VCSKEDVDNHLMVIGYDEKHISELFIFIYIHIAMCVCVSIYYICMSMFQYNDNTYVWLNTMKGSQIKIEDYVEFG